MTLKGPGRAQKIAVVVPERTAVVLGSLCDDVGRLPGLCPMRLVPAGPMETKRFSMFMSFWNILSECKTMRI